MVLRMNFYDTSDYHTNSKPHLIWLSKHPEKQQSFNSFMQGGENNDCIGSLKSLNSI